MTRSVVEPALGTDAVGPPDLRAEDDIDRLIAEPMFEGRGKGAAGFLLYDPRVSARSGDEHLVRISP
ncbi:hypothetical protein [Bradyrhizobium sp. WSM1417]|uniref:hypothetical protein n=1 Tax=Bradyrhizobium sp. WSM1417 TaxID=754500 RepID=UPI0012EC19EF|nr:hypothetical protein [Bradyrhizobium sp. WSM1417]